MYMYINLKTKTITFHCTHTTEQEKDRQAEKHQNETRALNRIMACPDMLDLALTASLRPLIAVSFEI